MAPNYKKKIVTLPYHFLLYPLMCCHYPTFANIALSIYNSTVTVQNMTEGYDGQQIFFLNLE